MAEEYTETLRKAGLRVTAARMAVLRTLQECPHSDADQIRDAVHERLGSISGQAVYDALNGMTEVGILRRIAPAGSRARYEFMPPDNHHHIVCRVCNKMEDVPCATQSAPCQNPNQLPVGWSLAEAEVIYWGECPNCRQNHQPMSA